MNLIEALRALSDGKSIRATNWKKGLYIKMGPVVAEYSQGGSFDLRDLFQTDSQELYLADLTDGLWEYAGFPEGLYENEDFFLKYGDSWYKWVNGWMSLEDNCISENWEESSPDDESYYINSDYPINGYKCIEIGLIQVGSFNPNEYRMSTKLEKI